MQPGAEGCLHLRSGLFPEGVLNPIPRNTHSFGGFPSLSDKGSSGLMGLNALRNSSGMCHEAFPGPCAALQTANSLTGILSPAHAAAACQLDAELQFGKACAVDRWQPGALLATVWMRIFLRPLSGGLHPPK